MPSGFTIDHPRSWDYHLSLYRDKEIKAIKLEACSELLKLLAEPSRLRLLSLVQQEELTVAELAAITDLKQPRVSTHLAKLKEARLVSDRRLGVQAFYRYAPAELAAPELAMLQAICQGPDDPTLQADTARMRQLLRARESNTNWADSVAGDMERHYSPGRTWEAVTHALLECCDFGDVLDIASGDGVFAELIAPRSRTVRCIDFSERVVEAARKRLKRFSNTKVEVGDMHNLSLPANSFDQAMMLQALPYSESPLKLFGELARVLRPGGRVLGTALAKHMHENAVVPYGHRNLGHTIPELKSLMAAAGFGSSTVHHATRERKTPHFDILIFSATRS